MVGLGIAAGSITGSSVAWGTPPTGVEVQILSQNVVNGIEYVVTRVTVAPGGGTGWHYHPGEVFGYIKDGTMTHWSVPGDGSCTVDAVYGAGAPVKEGVGPGFVHNGRNEGNTPLVMEVVYINPAGAPRSVEVPEPVGCLVS
ncbi:MAG: cupin domain-containing protein [Mycobacterium sp.]|nr:cupin domain-containing protein [Mycobacterium sp.]